MLQLDVTIYSSEHRCTLTIVHFLAIVKIYIIEKVRANGIVFARLLCLAHIFVFTVLANTAWFAFALVIVVRAYALAVKLTW